MSNDLANQKQNADIVIAEEPMTPLQFWFPILAIVLLVGLGGFLLIESNYAYGLSLLLIAGLIWTQLK